MSLFDASPGSVTLRPGAGERAVGEVCGPDLRAGQVLHVLEVQLILAVVEHVDHLVRQDALHHSLSRWHILTDNYLKFIVMCLGRF